MIQENNAPVVDNLFEGVDMEDEKIEPIVDLFSPDDSIPSKKDKMDKIIASRKPAHEILLEEVNSKNNPFNTDNWKEGKWDGGNLLSAILSPTIMTGIKAVDVPIKRGFAAISNPLTRLQEPEGLYKQQIETGKSIPRILGEEVAAGLGGKKEANFSDVYNRGGLPNWASQTLGFVNEMSFLNAIANNPLTRTMKDMRKGGEWQLDKYRASKGTVQDLKNLYSSAYQGVDDVMDKVAVNASKVDDIILKNLKGIGDDVLEKIDRVVGGGFSKGPGQIDTGKKLKDVIAVLQEAGFKGWVKAGKTAGRGASKVLGAAKKYSPLKRLLYESLDVAEKAGTAPKGVVKHLRKLDAYATREYYPLLETLQKKLSSVDSFEGFIKGASGSISRYQASKTPKIARALKSLGADKALSSKVARSANRLIKEVGGFRRQMVVQNLIKMGVPSYILYKGLNAMNNTLKSKDSGGSSAQQPVT